MSIIFAELLRYIGNAESKLLGLYICCLLLPGDTLDESLHGFPFVLICRLLSLIKRKLKDVGF